MLGPGLKGEHHPLIMNPAVLDELVAWCGLQPFPEIHVKEIFFFILFPFWQHLREFPVILPRLFLRPALILRLEKQE